MTLPVVTTLFIYLVLPYTDEVINTLYSYTPNLRYVSIHTQTVYNLSLISSMFVDP